MSALCSGDAHDGRESLEMEGMPDKPLEILGNLELLPLARPVLPPKRCPFQRAALKATGREQQAEDSARLAQMA
jgi:hypothetical protein